MERIEVELLTDGGNNAVVRMPQRAFPGVVVQGDTLNGLLAAAREAVLAAPESDAAGSLVDDLTAMLRRYEAALSAHGIRKPYPDGV